MSGKNCKSNQLMNATPKVAAFICKKIDATNRRIQMSHIKSTPNQVHKFYESESISDNFRGDEDGEEEMVIRDLTKQRVVGNTKHFLPRKKNIFPIFFLSVKEGKYREIEQYFPPQGTVSIH